MKKSEFPPGWDEERVQRVISHYESPSEEESLAEDEAAYEDTSCTVMEVPNGLVPRVGECVNTNGVQLSGKETLMERNTTPEIFDDYKLEDLTPIQKTYITPDAKFIYFRKGEAENNVEIVAAIIGMIAVVYKVVKDYPKLKQGVKELIPDVKTAAKIVLKYIRKPFKGPVMHEIACPDKSEVTLSLEVLRRLGGDVRYLPRDRRGSFRFFVNDKEYCLFVRKKSGTFTGVRGSDPRVIASLKEAFESEWDELTALQDRLLPQIVGIAEAQVWANE